MLRSKRFWIGTSVSVLFLFFLFRPVNVEEMATALRGANYWYLTPAIGVYFVAFGFRAVRWRYLLHHLKPMPLLPLFRVLTIGYMANNILPVRLGEIVRSYLLGEKETLSKTSVFGSIVVERTLDGLVLVFFVTLATTGVALSPLLADIWKWAALVFGMAFVGLLLVVLLPGLMVFLTHAFLRVLPGPIRPRVAGLIQQFIVGFQVLRNPRFLGFSFLLSLPVWLGEAGMYFIVSQAFELHLSWSIVLMATAISNLALSVPSSQGGIGPFEFFVAQTVVLSGVAQEAAAAYAIVLHAALLIPVTLLGLVFLWIEGVNLQVALRQGHPPVPAENVARDSQQ